MLKLDKVDAAFDTSSVLSDVTLQIQDNDAVALLGRNGAGKTTLLRVVAGLHPAIKGNIIFNHENITALPAYERARRGIALVPQGRGIFPYLTVMENLELGLSALIGREMPAKNKIPTYIFEMFPALARLRTRKGGVLSGGEQQQLAIARALLSQPKLLMLDEPTEGIQPSVVQEIETALNIIRKELGIAILLVEQFLDFAWEIADRYYIMQRGQLIRDGSTKEESSDSIAHLLNI